MERKEKYSGWVKVGVFLFLLGVIGVLTGRYLIVNAVDDDFFIADKANADSSQQITEYTMTENQQSFYVNTSGGFTFTSDEVSWVIDDKDIIRFADSPAINTPKDENGNPKNTQVLIEAVSPGRTTLTVNIDRGNGSGQTMHYQKTVWITVPLKVQKRESSIPGFKQLYVDSTENILIMGVDHNGQTSSGSSVSYYQLQSQIGKLGHKQNYESSNEAVATVSGGAVTAVGAGTATITITTQGTQIQTDTVTVYVMPQGRVDGKEPPDPWQFHASGSMPIEVSGGSVDFEIDATNSDTIGNIVWVVEKYTASPIGANNEKGTIVFDGLNGVTSSYVTSVQPVYNDVTGKAVVTLKARTGYYRVYGLLRDMYEGHTLEVILSRNIKDYLLYFDVNLSPNLRRETFVTMNVGDTYDILGGFNIPTEDIGNYFSTGEDGSYFYGQGDYNNYFSIDRATGIVTALRATVSDNIGQDPYKDIQMECKLPEYETVYIHIRIIDGFTLNASEITLYTGATFQLYAIDSMRTVYWSTDPANQTVISLDNGLVTGLKAGTVNVLATQTDDQGVTKTIRCKVTVVNSATSIVLDPSQMTMEVGEYKTILAKVSPANNTALPSIKWISSDESVVSITDSSATTAATLLANAPGIAVITAINTDNIILGSCVVTVEELITAIKFPQSAITLPLSMGQMLLTPTYTPSDATATNLRWTSTNTKVATIAANGLLTLKSAGQTVISVQSVSNPEVIAYCTVTVTTSVTGIYLDESSKTIQVGESYRLTYYCTPSNASDNKVTWSALDKSVASVKDGVVTGSKAGQTYIMAKASSGATAMCLVTVEQDVAGIKLNTNSLSLRVGDVYYANATITPATATNKTVTWKSKDAKVASVTNDGKITAVSAGTTTITATTPNNQVAEIEVTVEQPVTGLTLNYKSQTVLVDESFDLKAVISPAKSTNENVSWSSDDTGVASVSSTGTVKGISAGTTLVTCTTEDGGYMASCVVIVKEPVTSLTIDKKKKKIGIKKTFTLVATVDSNAATNSKVSWSSTNNKIAKITNVSADGNTATVRTLKKGSAEIVCRTTDGSGLSASCNTKVIKLVSSIKLNKSYKRLLEGKSIKLKAKVKPKKASQKKVTWTSDNPDIAMVNTNGKVIALKEGEATITAVTGDYKVNGKKSAACRISVYAAIPASSILTGQKDMTMIRGGRETISATITPADSTDSLKFISDNPRVASVNKKTGAVKAVSTGTATITITSTSGKQATVEVKVVGLNYSSIQMEQYDTFQLRLEAGGSEADYNVSWNSSNPSVATVTQNGLVSAKKAGTTVVTAYVNGASLTCTVRVSDIT